MLSQYSEAHDSSSSSKGMTLGVHTKKDLIPPAISPHHSPPQKGWQRQYLNLNRKQEQEQEAASKDNDSEGQDLRSSPKIK